MVYLIAAVMIVMAAILAYAVTRPDLFHVERAIEINASPEKIFPHINDFRRWDAWTPFDKDPEMTRTYSGADQGRGARFAWEGNRQAGKGEITITDSVFPCKLMFDLHMVKPFEGRNAAVISLQPTGGGTRVTWALEDRQGWFLKTMRLFVNLDRMIGRDFETGLARLKTVSEELA